jgi:hypothetical protein
MTITLEIGPALQAELVRQAAADGMGIDAYAASLLEEAAHLPPAPRQPKSSLPAKDVAEAIERLKTYDFRWLRASAPRSIPQTPPISSDTNILFIFSPVTHST